MRSLITSILLVSLSFCGTVTQTDWSGGSGVQGPVSDWNDEFWSSDAGIGLSGGKLELSSYAILPIEHNVAGYLNGARSVYSTDVDGDGDADILGASWGAYIIWWENTDGTGTNWIEHIVDSDFYGANSVYSNDIDGDGDPDILGAGSAYDDINWWENTDGAGTTWTEHVIDGNFDGAQSVFSTDIDGDGDADIIGAARYADDITWWENTDGTGTVWTEHTVDGDFDLARSVYATDVDGDGDADILGAGSDDITWWENTDGTGIVWTEHTIDGSFQDAWSVCAKDIDGDSDEDVLGAGYYADDIAWWENTDGTGTSWIEHTVDGDFDGASSVYATDVDGDGDSDILGAAVIADAIVWWENTDGTGTVWIEHMVDGDFDNAQSVFSTDIDGDGDSDVLGAAFHGIEQITWWDVMESPVEGSLESSILDAGDVSEWNIFLSSSLEPAGTSVGFQFRSSDDSFNMGVWSDTVFSPDTPLSGILSDSTRYLQYKVILETSDPGVSPELAEVAFSYSLQVGVGESCSSEVELWSLSASVNPSTGFFSALVSVPETGLVELSLYDVSGRVVAQTSQEFPTGTHSVNFAGLSQGVYFCTMHAADFSATKRVVVLK